jgi:23S rRNA (adenine2503-C2)-methyltransferase
MNKFELPTGYLFTDQYSKKTENPMKKFELPTGYLFTDQYSKGELETLSIGDYGKDKNIKADFLGFTSPINGVANGACKPLSEKWVITLSTQYGCAMECNFCDCPKIDFKGNATFDDLKKQFYSALAMYPEVRYTDRLNVHFARMGEPIFNDSVFDFAVYLYQHKHEIYKETGVRIETVHPVLTSCLPRRVDNLQKLIRWIKIKNLLYNGQAGLQLSINSTSDDQRNKMFGKNKVLSLEEISLLMLHMPEPVGRKYCLNFAYATGFEVDAEKLRRLFNPEHFMVKITPIHNNDACRTAGIETIGGYDSYAPYTEVEENLKSVGFDVLVFVPSMDEEKGLVTCGNAVLSGSKIKLGE